MLGAAAHEAECQIEGHSGAPSLLLWLLKIRGQLVVPRGQPL
jgi:hypothetical protein